VVCIRRTRGGTYTTGHEYAFKIDGWPAACILNAMTASSGSEPALRNACMHCSGGFELQGSLTVPPYTVITTKRPSPTCGFGALSSGSCAITQNGRERPKAGRLRADEYEIAYQSGIVSQFRSHVCQASKKDSDASISVDQPQFQVGATSHVKS
jgi:hypothetical protein